MLKKFLIKRLILFTALIFSVFLIYLTPNKEYEFKSELNYIDNSEKSVIYLLDANNYVARTKVNIMNRKVEAKARELINILIKDGDGEENIPSGFKSLISSDTKINSIKYENGLIKIDFSSELLDTKKEYEEKIIEAIVYTLTSIEEVDKVIIYVDGDILSKLPKTGINLPSTLDKSYGINKEYNLDSYKNIDKVTVYYVSKYNDEEYYVPVTKYVNDNRDKIKIIIDSLASSNISNTNLMSYLNSNTVLLSSDLNDEALSLVFNQYIFNDLGTKNILEEVIYTISLSVEANYDIKEVSFNVNNEEIYKSVIKNT
jgi:germination protein M